MGNRSDGRAVRHVNSEPKTANARREAEVGESHTVWPLADGLVSALLRYGATVAGLALTTAALWPLRQVAGLLNVGLVYLVVIIGATVLAGRRAGILASLVGFLLLDFFMVPPYLTLAIGDYHNILALFVFLGVSLLISWLIASAQEQARQARLRAEDTSRLYELNRAIIGAQTTDEILPSLAQKVCEVFEAQSCRILLPGDRGRLSVAAQAPAGTPPLTRDEEALAAWAFEQGHEVGRGSGARRGAQHAEESRHAAFVPLQAAEGTTGVLAVVRKRSDKPFTPDERKVLVTFAGQAAVAIERLRLLREAQRAEMLARTDELKSALMSAVSHDLRTPLASITASVTSLMDRSITWDEKTQHDFLQGIYDEAQRLNKLVGNLLDMSRIEGGGLHPQKDRYSIGEVIEASAQRLEPGPAGHNIEIDVAAGMPLVLLDFTEIDQVLTNLLENAIKYAPPSSTIRVRAVHAADHIEVSVRDDGPGVPSYALPYLFDKFYRVGRDSGPAGTGLGLAIAKGLVEAHGGAIWAENNPGGGFCVTFTLPAAAHTAVAAPAVVTPAGQGGL